VARKSSIISKFIDEAEKIEIKDLQNSLHCLDDIQADLELDQQKTSFVAEVLQHHAQGYLTCNCKAD